MDNVLNSFEEVLDKNGHLSFTNVGSSMLPLIRAGRDVVIISKKQADRCKKNDVVLYRREGRCILHRILRVTKDGYIIAGDNNFHREKDVTDEMIIGVLTGLVRDGKKFDFNSVKYKFYSFFCCYFYYPKAVVLYLKYRIKVILMIVNNKLKKLRSRA